MLWDDHTHENFDKSASSKLSPVWRSYVLSQNILIKFLGRDWVVKYIHATDSKDNFLRNRAESKQDDRRHIERVVDLGEHVLNLNFVSGFKEKLDDLKKGHIESVMAELTCARILLLQEHPFKFVVRSEIKRSDFDFLFKSSENMICCETKCKIESNEVAVKPIMKSLRRANDQLPKDQPGMIMVSVPEISEKNNSLMNIYEESIRRFYGQNDRIISILFHSDILYFENENLEGRLFTLKEFVNKDNKFKLTDELFGQNKYRWNLDNDRTSWIDIRKLIIKNSH